jgi:hypothetical protein
LLLVGACEDLGPHGSLAARLNVLAHPVGCISPRSPASARSKFEDREGVHIDRIPLVYFVRHALDGQEVPGSRLITVDDVHEMRKRPTSRSKLCASPETPLRHNSH